MSGRHLIVLAIMMFSPWEHHPWPWSSSCLRARLWVDTRLLWTPSATEMCLVAMHGSFLHALFVLIEAESTSWIWADGRNGRSTIVERVSASTFNTQSPSTTMLLRLLVTPNNDRSFLIGPAHAIYFYLPNGTDFSNEGVHLVTALNAALCVQKCTAVASRFRHSRHSYQLFRIGTLRRTASLLKSLR